MARLADVGNVAPFCAPGALATLVSAALSRRSREEWALLARVPPLPLLGFGVYLGVAGARAPTSNNLWPFVMVFFILITAALFGLFLVGRWLCWTEPPTRRPRRTREQPGRWLTPWLSPGPRNGQSQIWDR